MIRELGYYKAMILVRFFAGVLVFPYISGVYNGFTYYCFKIGGKCKRRIDRVECVVEGVEK